MGREQEAAGPCDDVLDSLSTPFVMVNGQTGERTLPLLDLITVVARWDGYCSTRGSSIIKILKSMINSPILRLNLYYRNH